MAEKELTVYEALLEISRLNDKIKKFKSESKLFIYYSVESSNKINGINREDFIKSLQSNYDSIRHLISNLAEYKAKVALSNATTTIKIGEKEYTIAEAIQRKQNIKIESSFLMDLQLQISSAQTKIEAINSKVESKLPEYLNNVKTDNSTAEEIEKLTENYYRNNKCSILDPNKLVDNISTLVSDLELFLTEVDSKITTSNCKTIIKVNLED